MRKFLKIVISIPLLAGAGIIGANKMSAAVQEMGPSDAVVVLARSESIDAKCRYLSSHEHDELNDYVAKAEVAAARLDGAARASSAVRTGLAAGKSASCNRESEIIVRATMDAARRAIATTVTAHPASVTPQGQRAQKRASVSNLPGSVVTYSRLAAAYYVERRCQHLSHAQAVDFWKRIVRMHNYVLTSQGPDALSAAKSRAIAHAKTQRRCNSNTAQLVRASYQKIKRN